MSQTSALFIRKRRKAQWFLVGGLILAFMIAFVAATRGQVSTGIDTAADSSFAFKNIKGATTQALSDAVAENTSSPYMEAKLLDWKYMLDNFAEERASNISAIIFLGVPQSGYVNVTIINFFGKKVSNVNVSVGSQSVSGFDAEDNTVTTKYLAEGSNYFPVNVTYSYVDNGATQTDSAAFNTTRKAFFVYKLRYTKRGGDEVLQDIEYG